MRNEPSNLIYALMPAQPLPVVDLSKSFRGRLLPSRVYTYIRRRYFKYHRQIVVCGVISYCLNLVVVMVPSSVGQVLAVVVVLMWLPLGVGSLTTLRYDIVRLVVRTFDFWFFSTVTSVIVITISMYLSDTRWIRTLNDWFGFHHVIFIDAHVLGLRNLTYTLIFGMLSVVVVFIWIMLGRVDGGSTFTVVKYENEYGGFHLSGVDVIGNGLVCLGLLLVKIIFRRRKTLHIGRKTASSLIECVIYRCKLKLELQRPEVFMAGDSRRFGSKEISLRETDTVQHLEFVKSPQTFTADNILLRKILQRDSLPSWFLVAIYVVGALGFVLSHGIFFQDFCNSEENVSHKQLELIASWVSLICTIMFAGSFAVFYHCQLLKLLFSSFDFAFYSFQVTSTTICACSLFSWKVSQCLMSLSWWIWAHWIFTLDALTPVMRRMFKFRVHYAVPILCVLLAGNAVLVYTVLFVGNTQLQDSIVYDGTVWNQHVVIRVIPFYVSRSLTLILWCSRLVVRLALSGANDVTILRGSVCYDNIFANGRRSSSNLNQVINSVLLEPVKVQR